MHLLLLHHDHSMLSNVPVRVKSLIVSYDLSAVVVFYSFQALYSGLFDRFQFS